MAQAVEVETTGLNGIFKSWCLKKEVMGRERNLGWFSAFWFM